MPRSSCERITPELPLAPMRDPWAIALHTCARLWSLNRHCLVELRDHGLDGEGHVRPCVPVGNRIDVEPVDRLLVRSQQVRDTRA